ncbi:MAG: DUF1501 domain-containing protein [Thermogemmata sp.]|nr:DUF1501 domain-containing protein [Thermogemmata sp.]
MTLPWRTDCEGFHRRDFLQVGAVGALGLTLPGVLAAEAQARSKGAERPAKARSVILLWLAGGPATIDMWDNKPEAPEGIRGEFKNIPTSVPGLFFSEPLPKSAQIAHKLTVVRSLYHSIPSHGPASLFMTTGNKPTPALQYPSFGSLAARLLSVPRGVPPYVTFGGNANTGFGLAGYLGTSYNPFIIEGNPARSGDKGNSGYSVRGLSLTGTFTLEDLEKRDKLLRQFDSTFAAYDRSSELMNGLDTFHQQALDILRSNRTRQALDLSQEKPTTREMYGNTPFGQGALAARRLIEAGVRFATVTFGGWDTHNQNFTRLKNNLLPVLDTVLSALVRDLDDRGLLDSTIVMVAGEFNRTPKINRTAGRDHWARSMAVVLAGGGFPRGYVHGSTDASGMAPATDPCTPDDLGATLFTHLGIDPHLELTTPTGRPMQLFREGRPIEKLLG